MDGDMMMDKKKEEEDKGPNGCLVCLEATWNGMVVSKQFPIVLIHLSLGRVQCHQIHRDGYL